VKPRGAALVLVTLAACGGRLDSPGADAALNSDAAVMDGADGAAPVICAGGGGKGLGVCPDGWHCDLLHWANGEIFDVCCPPGQTGNSSQCVFPQN